MLKNRGEKKLSHGDIKIALQTGETMHHKVYRIGNESHELYTLACNKISLSSYDDTSCIMKDGIHTLAHGNFRIDDVDT